MSSDASLPVSQEPRPDELIGLRKRIHFLERHNQYFERCESAWCHPTEKDNPALGIILGMDIGQQGESAATPPSEAPRPSVAGGEAKPHFSWQRVYALLEQWRELWGGDKQQVTADHPEWIINAANELFAHDLCDEWNWNEYVGEASEIIARHFAASRTTRSAPAAPHLSGGVTGGFGGLSAADTTPSSAQLPSPEPTNFVSDTSLPSCHVCGEIMVGVCRKCGASTKPKWIPVNDGRGQTIGFTKAQVSKDK